MWVDVRLPSEFKYEHIDGALNLPLKEIRQLAKGLDENKEYVLYCQTGKRSSAAAFVLTQSGLKAFMLAGGMRDTL
ncbi:rhodanese-like domain-containing protein [Methylotenera sp.]|uniref:rhodanese-like domain-containing protein n=1 Tax=Methylotenera sp. TaxID=2051956 RepID=UPI003453D562